MALRLESLSMWLAMAALTGATVLYAYFVLTKRPQHSRYATALTGAAFLMLTASIGLHSSSMEGSRLFGPYSLALAAWALVLVYFVVEHLVKLKVYGTVLVPIALLLIVAEQILLPTAVGVRPAATEAMLLDSWRVIVHVALIVFANAGFAIGAAASATYLALEAQLKQHRTSTLFKRLPSLAQTDLVARRAIVWAYPAYAAGLLLGILRAIETDVLGWWADPRVMLAGLVWGAYTAYLYLHYGRNTSGRTTAIVALAGFLVVVALAIVARSVPAGFHVFGVAGL
jgi:ABC-type transport system involved in cytochrome c biogenesis permease subunit